MSVDNHRHCQATVLSANGTGDGNGSSWNEIASLSLDNLTAIDRNWKERFSANTGNITQDLATILTLLNSSNGHFKGQVTEINGKITTINTNISNTNTNITNISNIINGQIDGLNTRLTLVEGATAQLQTKEVIVYLAPDKSYFNNNSSLFTHGTEPAHDPDENLRDKTLDCYTPKEGAEYSYQNGGKIYSGSDDNLEWQSLSDDDREQSDKKSIELFGMDNKSHYNILLLTYV